MKDKDRVALARIVLANREHVMAIEPSTRACSAPRCATTTRCATRRTSLRRIPCPRVDKEMVDLASHILDTRPAISIPAKFKDEYETALKKLVKRKAAGKTIEPPEETEKSTTSSIWGGTAAEPGVGPQARPANRRRRSRAGHARRPETFGGTT